MMQLPWVSRRAFEMAVEAQSRAETQLDIRERHWAERCDALLISFTEMAKRQVPEQPTLKERSRDEVIDAIMLRSGSNGQLRAHLSAYAARARREQMKDEEIVQHILVWASPDDDDPLAGVP